MKMISALCLSFLATTVSAANITINPGQSIGSASPSAGDTVFVAAGTYRGGFTASSGAAGNPVVYWTDPTDRAVLSGAREITGTWTQCTASDLPGNDSFANIYYMDVTDAIDHVYEDGIELNITSMPAQSYARTTGAPSNYELTDDVNLWGGDDAWVGGQIHYWPEFASGRRIIAQILGYDAATKTLSVEHAPIDKNDDYIVANESYRLENHVNILRLPGHHVVDNVSIPGKSRLYVWPMDSGSPVGNTYETRDLTNIVEMSGKHDIIFHGFEVRFGGTGFNADQDVDNIVIENCFSHDNGNGINASGTNVWVKKSTFTREGTSINLRVTNIYVDSCHVFRGTKDGIQFAGNGTDGMQNGNIDNSFIHEQLGTGHPDLFQTFNGSDGITLRNSALVNGGQGLMLEDAKNLTLEKCLITSTSGSAIAGWEHENTTLDGNTFWDAQNGLVVMGTGSPVIEGNILGNESKIFKASTRWTSYTADYNLYAKGTMDYDGAQNLDFASYQAATGQETHSAYADPQFVNVPVSIYKNDKAGFFRNTPTTLFLGRVTGISVGDKIEVQWDDVLRTVTAVNTSDMSVTFTPATSDPLISHFLVVNWGADATSALKDYRIKPTSPAYGARADGSNMGAAIDLQEFRNRDWDGDGKVDMDPVNGNTGADPNPSNRKAPPGSTAVAVDFREPAMAPVSFTVNPNPVLHTATISFGADHGPALMPVEIYTASGTLVKTLQTGTGAIHWDGKDRDGQRLQNGTYYVRSGNALQKILIIE